MSAADKMLFRQISNKTHCLNAPTPSQAKKNKIGLLSLRNSGHKYSLAQIETTLFKNLHKVHFLIFNVLRFTCFTMIVFIFFKNSLCCHILHAFVKHLSLATYLLTYLLFLLTRARKGNSPRQ